MRVAVLASGRGSNFARLLEAQGDRSARSYEIVLLGVDRPCPAEDIALRGGVEVYTAAARETGMEGWERGLLARSGELGVQGVVLGGFMRILSPQFVSRFPARILNVHPSLLPAFPGRDAIGQALRYGVRETGVTVHLVDETLDGGPIVLQEALRVSQQDDEATLSARIHALEHRLLPQAVELMARGRLAIDGRKVTILEG